MTDDRIDAALPRIRHAVDGLGDLVDSYHHLLGSVSGSHERIFAQYADRCQVDLGKYLHRGSAWEAHDRLGQHRAALPTPMAAFVTADLAAAGRCG
ncbi:MAG: hypothetical protein ACYCO9_05400 [Streptosporangiaceae bacterium]